MANRYQQRALIVGVVFAVLTIAGIFLPPETGGGAAQFFRSYLLAFVFWVGICAGSLALLMLQHLTGGAWGMVIRRVLEAATRTLPLLIILFVPLVFGLSHIYEWVHPEQIAETAARTLVESKVKYLNVTFFMIRAAIYFAVWAALTFLLNKWSGEQDRTANRRLSRQFRMLSGPGLALFVLTVTFASVDWVMSLEPEWFSTIFGLIFVIGWVLTAFALVIAVMVLLAGHKPMDTVLRPNHFQDLGKLLLAFVMLWAYFNFSQYLIIWSGNIPEETKWYLHRTRGGWGWIAIAVVIFHFALPFLMLLSRDLKRNARRLAVVAIVVFLMRFIDLLWIIAPTFRHEHLVLSWLDITAPLAMGGLWVAFFVWQLKQRPLLPINDPYLGQTLEQSHHH
ncbi:MAG: hypothetical protein QOF02_880 [Blastocatellia bacterium]|nr:hypothetical protein [Blastocatellia bacterium]